MNRIKHFCKIFVNLALIIQLSFAPLFAGLDRIIVDDGINYLISKQHPVVILNGNRRYDTQDFTTFYNAGRQLYYTALPFDFEERKLEILFDHSKDVGTPVSRIVYNENNIAALNTRLDHLGLRLSFTRDRVRIRLNHGYHIPYFSVLSKGTTYYYLNERVNGDWRTQDILDQAWEKHQYTIFTDADLRNGIPLGNGLRRNNISHLTIFSPFIDDPEGPRKLCSRIEFKKELLIAISNGRFTADRTITQIINGGNSGNETINPELKQATEIHLRPEESEISSSEESDDSHDMDPGDSSGPHIGIEVEPIEVEPGEVEPGEIVDDSVERMDLEEPAHQPEMPAHQIEKIEIPKHYSFFNKYSRTQNLQDLEHAEEIAKSNKDNLALAKIYDAKATYYNRIDNNKEKAITLINTGLGYLETLNEPEKIVTKIIQLSLLLEKGYLIEGEESKEIYDEAIKIARSTESKELEIKAMLCKAHKHYSLELYEEILKKAEDSEDPYSLAKTYRLLSHRKSEESLNRLFSHKESEEHMQCSEKAFYYAGLSGDQELVVKILQDHGNYYAALSKAKNIEEKSKYFDKSFELFQKSLEISQKHGYQNKEALALCYMGELITNDAKYYEKALQTVPKNDPKTQKRILSNLIGRYAKIGNLEKATEYSEKFLQIAKEHTNRTAQDLAMAHSQYAIDCGKKCKDNIDIAPELKSKYIKESIEHTKNALELVLLSLKLSSTPEETKSSLISFKHQIYSFLIGNDIASKNTQDIETIELCENYLKKHVIDSVKNNEWFSGEEKNDLLFNAYKSYSDMFRTFSKNLHKSKTPGGIKSLARSLKPLLEAKGYARTEEQQNLVNGDVKVSIFQLNQEIKKDDTVNRSVEYYDYYEDLKYGLGLYGTLTLDPQNTLDLKDLYDHLGRIKILKGKNSKLQEALENYTIASKYYTETIAIYKDNAGEKFHGDSLEYLERQLNFAEKNIAQLNLKRDREIEYQKNSEIEKYDRSRNKEHHRSDKKHYRSRDKDKEHHRSDKEHHRYKDKKHHRSRDKEHHRSDKKHDHYEYSQERSRSHKKNNR